MRFSCGTNDVADADPADRTNRRSLGCAHSRSKTNEDWCPDNIAHGNVRYRNVLDNGSVDGHDRQAETPIEDTVRDRNILEPPVRFCPKLDAPVPIDFGLIRKSPVRSVNQAAL